MAKFPGLVKNEYIKVCTKVSTWVLLILVAVTAIGYNGVIKIGQVVSEKRMANNVDQSDYLEDYRRAIEDLKSADYDNKETEIEKYQFLIDNNISYDDWRRSATEETFQEKQAITDEEASGMLTGEALSSKKASLENMLTALRTDNWKNYYTLKVNQYKSDSMLTAEQKEAYSYSYQYALTHNLDPDEDNWQNNLLSELSGQKQQLAMGTQQDGSYDAEEEAQRRKTEESVLKLEYQLEHGLKSVAYEASLNNTRDVDFWTVLGLSNILINVISGVIIIIAGGSIANEFTNGTIKFLLINPVKRWKIFLSKYAMILSMSVLLVLGFFLLNVLCGGILFGFGDILNPYLYVVDGAVHRLPGLLFILWQYLIGSVNLLVMGTLAFAISSLLRNSAVAIGVSIFALLAGNTITMFLRGFNMDWARFLIFANVDLNAVMSGTTMFEGMTVGFSLSVIAVHMVIFFLTAWDGFMRRDSI